MKLHKLSPTTRSRPKMKVGIVTEGRTVWLARTAGVTVKGAPCLTLDCTSKAEVDDAVELLHREIERARRAAYHFLDRHAKQRAAERQRVRG